ncbi:MAG: hypothetical protein JO000_05215 [Alphaproteobacteria bacterium]|nr:hypothetical protein [Alphaproteobacteria bacterium]
MPMKVNHMQFAIDGDRLTHTPTGAVFWIGARGLVSCDWGDAGAALRGGSRYDREELSAAAREILLRDRARSL